MKNLKITKTDKVEENKNNHRFFSGLTGENIALNEFQNANDILNTVSTSKISCKTYLYYI